jgi:PAS domain S-box-containing protein
MFQSALEALDEAICLCDQTGNVLYANPAAERLTGCSKSEARGKNCIQVLGSLATTILQSAQGEKSKTIGGISGWRAMIWSTPSLPCRRMISPAISQAIF